MSAFTRAGENGRLTVAVPAKGRMAEPTLRLCADAGLSFETTERSLVVPCANAPGRPPARPAERHPRVRPGRRRPPRGDGREPRRRGAGRRPHARGARLRALHAAGGGARTTRRRPRSPISAGSASRPPTPSRRRLLLDERGVDAELVPVSGSVEATPRLGLADAIVDLVSTGSTASANGLRLIGTLLSSQAVLIGGARRGRGAARARRAARADALRRGRRATPALRDDERDDRDAARDPRRAPEHGRAHRPAARATTATIAVHAAVAADEVWSLLPALRDAGATSILVVPDREARAVRGAGLDDAIAVAAPIVADVRDRGDAALLEWTERFDGPRPDGFRVSRERDRRGARATTTCSRRCAP